VTALDSPIRVFVVDDSGMMRRALSQVVDAQDDMEVVDTASTGHEAVRRATELQPDITLMDIHMPDMDGIQATWLVSNKVPNGGVIMVTSEERIDFIQKAMSAGAQGYVLKPFGDGAQLLQTVRDVHARMQGRRLQLGAFEPTAAPAAPPKFGERIVVFGAKGGVGKTAVAVGLALALHLQTHESVLLFDADFVFGDANIHLNLATELSIIDLLPHIDALDSRLLDRVTAKHSSGIQLLAAAPRPEQADVITGSHVRALLSMMGNTFDYVVSDTHAAYDERMLGALDLADAYVVVFTPEMGSLRSTRHFIEVAGKLGYPVDRMHFVLNRASDQSRLRFDDIAAAIGTRQILQIPNVGRELSDSINDGRPLLLHQPRSAFSRAIQTLAEQVSSEIALRKGR
jgi:pilus assembly protein CpaE